MTKHKQDTQRPDTTHNVIDEQDWRNLLVTILNQTIDDYVKLQHPASRNRKYLQEFYLTAIAFLFDDTYTLENIKNGFNEDMSVPDLISEVMDTDKPNMKRLRQYAINQTKEYWENKNMPVIDHIPDTVCISGETYMVQHAHISSFAIDHEAKTIVLDKHTSDTNKTNFLKACMTVIIEQEDLSNAKITAAAVSKLTKALAWLLKVNNCFVYVGVPAANTLFAEDTKRES